MHSRPLTLKVPNAAPDDPISDGDLSATVRQLLAQRPRLPLPGGGDTLARWRSLATLAGTDVCLAKVLEAHYDAQAILAELGQPQPPDDVLLAVWAAEPPDAQVSCTQEGGVARVTGTKAWCSGAGMADAALITSRSNAGVQLVHVDMRDAGVSCDDSTWQAVGMGRVVSGRVSFAGVAVRLTGAPGAYVDRPGFWHGGAGIAACWFGGAAAIADALRTHPRAQRDPHARAHLGAVDVMLAAAAAHLREVATLIDTRPGESHQTSIMQVRALLERTCAEVIDRTGRALGPAPLCENRAHALRCADLAVFIRQSHAERDWAELGKAAAEREATWTL